MNVTPKTYPQPLAPVGQNLSARPWMPFRGTPRPAVTIATLFAAFLVGVAIWQHAEQLAALVELAVFAAASRGLVRA